MRLLFVRHAPTDWNREGRYQGRTDTPIGETGLREARRIAETLRGVAVDLVVTSPLRRALETAEVIAAALGGVRRLVDGRLVEISFGDWEGFTQEEIRARWPTALRAWKRTPQAARFPGGESLHDLERRLRDFLRTPPWRGEGCVRNVVAVSHAGPIRLARLLAERRSLAEFREVPVVGGIAQEFRWSASEGLAPNLPATSPQDLP
ncbi:MAG: histidine phosphatase family protein [Gammaproteobacteria bacterium]|nr:histidine phosphatase family protein [Gammaproteobacteria bacterium]